MDHRRNFAQTNLRMHRQYKLVQQVARMRRHDGCAKNFVGTSHGQNFGETRRLHFPLPRRRGAASSSRHGFSRHGYLDDRQVCSAVGGLNEQGTHGRNYSRADLLFDHIFKYRRYSASSSVGRGSRSGCSPVGKRHSRCLPNGNAKSLPNVSSFSSRYAATPMVTASCGISRRKVR